MTNRNFFETIASIENLSADLREHAVAQLEKMDSKNKARSSKPSKTALANEPIKQAIMEYLAKQEEPCTASNVCEALEISVHKASSLLCQLTDEEKLVKSEVKVPKKGMQKAYAVKVGE